MRRGKERQSGLFDLIFPEIALKIPDSKTEEQGVSAVSEPAKQEATNSKPQERWFLYVALTSALLAVGTGITTLQSGSHSSRVLLNNIAASNLWSYYQAKSVKFNILNTEAEILRALGRKPDPKDAVKMEEYQKEMEQIKADAEEKTRLADQNAQEGARLVKAVTFFQIAIAMSAIAILIRRKGYWYFGLGIACIGLYFVALKWFP